MNRKDFVKAIASFPFILNSMQLSDLNKLRTELPNSMKMPVLFLGHGNPMNAIEENEFVEGFRDISKTYPKPKAIVCISAHWETEGTKVTAMPMPQTIHDFGGFPKALYEVQYPAHGNPELSNDVKNRIQKADIILDEQWGLDHGAWTVLKHFYPNADVPVIQLSLDYRKSADYHYELAKELAYLRQKGVLIVGSGNMIHNLGLVAWDKLSESEYGYDWAIEANEKMKQFILSDDHKSLIDFKNQGKEFLLSVPTPEHYLPLIYTLALKEKNEDIFIFNDKAIGGSLTMTSVKIG